ncbi:MAG: hypothetical protein IPF72_10470 [Chitinophagaceae bacterium]|nr:hypothetical protein [Chitinophagaceae bacterium]
METTKIIKEFNECIDRLLQRFQINHIICISSDCIVKKWDFKKVDKYLDKNIHHRIIINSAIFLNSLKEDKLLNQYSENEDLKKYTRECSAFIHKQIEELSQLGENKYTLNELIRETVQKIESEISVMNYDSWLRIKNPNNYDEVLLLLLKNERKSYRKSKMDIETFCMPFFEDHFTFRKMLLHHIKSNLADVFSKYLLLPRINTNPKIEYTCNQTDICELILQFQMSLK